MTSKSVSVNTKVGAIARNQNRAQSLGTRTVLPHSSRNPRNRSALATTDTGLRFIASAASIGDNSKPLTG